MTLTFQANFNYVQVHIGKKITHDWVNRIIQYYYTTIILRNKVLKPSIIETLQ